MALLSRKEKIILCIGSCIVLGGLLTARAYLNTVGKAPGVEYILDTTDYLYAEGGGYAMPETVVFDRTGNEVARIRGTLTLPDLRIRIEELLGEGG